MFSKMQTDIFFKNIINFKHQKAKRVNILLKITNHTTLGKIKIYATFKICPNSQDLIKET
jgi:hypothetical protein